MSFNESPDTYQARKILKEIFGRKYLYEIDEEVLLETVTNNMEEEIYPPYRADMLLTKQFIIELDPQSNKKGKSKGHGTKRRRIHDQWRDKNIKNQMNISTVRLEPKEIIAAYHNDNIKLIVKEVQSQLEEQNDEYYHFNRTRGSKYNDDDVGNI